MKNLLLTILTTISSLAAATEQPTAKPVNPAIQARILQCREFRDKIKAYQKKYNVPELMTGFAIKDLETQKVAIALLSSSPVLAPPMRDEITRLLGTPINQANATQYLADHVSVIVYLNCGNMFESETIAGLLNSAKLGTTGVNVADVKKLWKEFLEKQLTSLISISIFQSIEQSSSLLEREKVIHFPAKFVEARKEVEKFIVSNRPPKTSAQPTVSELVALAKHSQGRLRQEIDLENKMRAAVQLLVREN